jgi:hypothetical protein
MVRPFSESVHRFLSSQALQACGFARCIAFLYRRWSEHAGAQVLVGGTNVEVLLGIS